MRRCGSWNGRSIAPLRSDDGIAVASQACGQNSLQVFSAGIKADDLCERLRGKAGGVEAHEFSEVREVLDGLCRRVYPPLRLLSLGAQW